MLVCLGAGEALDASLEPNESFGILFFLTENNILSVYNFIVNFISKKFCTSS